MYQNLVLTPPQSGMTSNGDNMKNKRVTQVATAVFLSLFLVLLSGMYMQHKHKQAKREYRPSAPVMVSGEIVN